MTRGPGDRPRGKFIHWIQNSAAAKKIIETNWIPLTITKTGNAARWNQPSRRVLERLRRPWPDRRAELLLGAVACLLAVAIVAMIVFVARGAWPTFSHDGLSLFGSGGNVDSQIGAMENTIA